MEEKRPDNFCENAALLPYGSNVSAPSIKLPDVGLFKQEKTNTARQYFNGKIEELNREYQALVKLAEQTSLVYGARYNFVPIVGNTYYLYWTGNDHLLSLVGSFKQYERLGSYIFTSDGIWERIDD